MASNTRIDKLPGTAFLSSGFYKDEKILSLMLQPIMRYTSQMDPSRTLRIADIGCGTASVGLYIEKQLQAAGYSPHLLLIDSDPNMLASIEQSANREMVLTDLADLPSKVLQAPVDIIVGRQFIHYAAPEKQKKILEEAYKYLNKSGLFVNATSAHENPNVVYFMTDLLNKIRCLKDPNSPPMFYQTTETYLNWIWEAGFDDPYVAAQYFQPCKTSDYYESYEFASTEMGVETVKNLIKELIETMNPPSNVQEAMNIRKHDGHYLFNMTCRIFVGNK